MQVPSSNSVLRYLVDDFLSLVVLLTRELSLGSGPGGGCNGQSACDITDGCGGDVSYLS